MSCHKQLPPPPPHHDHGHCHDAHHWHDCHFEEGCGCIEATAKSAESASASAKAAAESAALAQRVLQNCLTDKTIAPGGGLVYVPGQGIVVDFTQMPTDKFEALLKSLRLPIWLNGNMDIYVNGNSDGDSLVDGRGTLAKPFKTIQAAVNYVCDNYNVGDYVATVHVAAGTYNEAVNLKEYSRMSGFCRIEGAGGEQTLLRYAGAGARCALLAGRSLWKVHKMAIERVENAEIADVYGQYTVLASDNASLSLYDCAMKMTQTTGDSAFTAVVHSTFGGNLNIFNGCSITGVNTSGKACNMYALASCARIVLENDPQHDLIINGAFKIVAYCETKSTLERGSLLGNCSGNATGQRYLCSLGSLISVRGAGQNYFPGSEAGYVDSASFSVYQ